jgi:hypothetical protein
MMNYRSDVVDQVMTEDELVSFLEGVDLSTDAVFESLHYYNVNSHLIKSEGVNIEVTYNRRVHKYLVSMW